MKRSGGSIDIFSRTTGVGGFGCGTDGRRGGPSKSSAWQVYTKTNTQVAGVDKADFFKNDGTCIFSSSSVRSSAVKGWLANAMVIQSSMNSRATRPRCISMRKPRGGL